MIVSPTANRPSSAELLLPFVRFAGWARAVLYTELRSCLFDARQPHCAGWLGREAGDEERCPGELV